MNNRTATTGVFLVSVRRLLLAVALAGAIANPASAQLASELVVSGLSSPVAFVQDPSRPDVQLVVEQGGLIKVVQNGTVLEEPFLDLTAEVLMEGERGLLGFAFAPDYATSGRVYVNFTNTAGHTVIARFLRSASDPLKADPASRFDLVWPGGLAYIEQPFANHNGGNLAFGPDGYLYIGMGDGGDANDPDHRAQDPGTLLGKMLRIDVSVDDSHPTGYVVPPTNPFVADPDVLDEIWAFGYRNPWRFSFDDPTRGGTGALITGDVGQAGWEEIDYEPAGAAGRNYGWRNREGMHDNVTTLPPFSAPLIDPIFEYPRNPTGGAVTGGLVYRGTALGAAYHGRYFFGDIGGGVWSIALSIDPGTGEATASDLINHTTELGTGAASVSSFGVDANGELYVVNHGDGQIHRVVLAAGSCASPQPVADWVCVDGGWVPPELAPGATPPPTPPPTECMTPQPVADWVCVNGGWIPPGLAPGGTPPPPPPPPTTECTTPQPVADWVCVNGGWIPPDLAPGGTPPPPTPSPAVEDCGVPDPFAGIPGLAGICVNGGWIPTQLISSSATIQFHAEEGGFWALHLEDGRVFVPMEPLDPAFEVEDLVVMITGKVRSDLESPQGAIIEIVTIVE